MEHGCPLTLQNEQPTGFPGPSSEFNYGSGIQGAFPFEGPKTTLSGDEGKNITTIRNDGSFIAGYQPSIIRPLDTIQIPRNAPNGSNCNWPCYSGGKYQEWCNKDNAVNFYAMRPLVTPDTYNGWLTNLFNYLVKPGHEASSLLTAELKPNVFCESTKDNMYSSENVVMDWLMEQIAGAVNKIPQLQNNGPWRKEEFHKTDVQFYSFIANVGGKDSTVYKVIFNLYNPLRSTATLVETVILNPQNTQNFVIAKMDFVNSGEWKTTNENIPPGMQGYNLPKAGSNFTINMNSASMPDPTTLQWNYGNTLEKQEFNEWGFYEPGYNIQVKGGVPETLKPQLAACEGSMLMGCEVNRYNGINSQDKMVRNDGLAHLVKNNPSVIYANSNDSSAGGQLVYN